MQGRSDPRRVLFGGRDAANTPNDETWLWDGTAWTQLSSPVSPPPRSAAAMADGATNVGGMNASGLPLDDTWVCNGAGWQQVNAVAPPARWNHALATDAGDPTGSVYMFGGSDGQNWFSDLRRLGLVQGTFGWYWQWNVLPSGPDGRDIHAMAIDLRRRKLVLFGGRDEFFQQRGDTWEFDLNANTWSQRFPAHSPPARVNHGMAYDRQRERIVLVGGYDMNSTTYLDDIWEWDGTDWTARMPETRSIAPTENPAVTYDPATQRIVVFGGWSGGPSDNTYEILEVTGPTAPSQNAPLSLSITSTPAVYGTATTPLGVEVPASGNLSALFLGLGPAPQPYAIGPAPLFCTAGQTLFVQGLVSYLGFGNPGRFTVPIPPIAAGALLSFQAVALTGNGCIDASPANFSLVQTLQ